MAQLTTACPENTWDDFYLDPGELIENIGFWWEELK
jgi:hypothetical protein